MRIIVSGCGRSGTQYTANLLRALGLKGGHERVYRHDLEPDSPDHAEIKKRWEDSDFESSWLAAPFLEHIPPFTVVWHQLRDPLKVLRCWNHHRILTDFNGDMPPPESAACFVKRVLPECDVGTNLERSLKYVLGWSALLDRHEGDACCFRYRLEAMTPEHWQLLLHCSGRYLPLRRIRQAVDDVPRSAGSCLHPPGSEIPWSAVLDTKVGGEFRELAVDQGYEVA